MPKYPLALVFMDRIAMKTHSEDVFELTLRVCEIYWLKGNPGWSVSVCGGQKAKIRENLETK